MLETKKHTSFTMTGIEYEKVQDFLAGNETTSGFCYKAMQEKIKRMEVRDKNARIQLHNKDVLLLEPVIVDVLKMHGIM